MLIHYHVHFFTLKEWVGFFWPIYFWQYPNGQMFNLINSHWLVCTILGAYVKTLLVIIVVYAIFLMSM
jgi:hypothetical protein